MSRKKAGRAIRCIFFLKRKKDAATIPHAIKKITMPINYKEYHPKWSLISKLIRFTRAKNKCEQCGAVNYDPHPVTGSKVVLTVAHIDHDKTNNRFCNLAAWCQRCHLRHDIRQHVDNRKYGRNWKGEHQIKFKL